MEDLVTLTVDGVQMQAPKGTLLWEACKSHGIDIPIFCYHTKLGPVGACRTCLVEIEGMAKGPATACSTPVTDGMVVRTRSAVVEKAQRGIFEFLLANHPLDCPICDRGGECPLQDQAFSFGPGTSRYVEPKRHHMKPIVLGPTIALDRERCVLCWRCVRFCAEIAEDKSIVLHDRGDHSIVGTFHDEPYVSNFSGNVVELCPVGALTSRKQRFNFRPWELKNRPSICPHCALGCNITISVRKNDDVIRFLSRDNPEVDDSWLCDRGRYNFEFINSPERISSPLVRQGDRFVETSWHEALQFIADKLLPIVQNEEISSDAIVGIVSPRLTNEDLFVFKRFMRDVLGSVQVDHYPRPALTLTPAQQSAMDTLSQSLVPVAALDTARTIVLLGADPSTREPVLELRVRMAVNRHAAQLVVIQSEEMPLTAKANRSVAYPRERFADLVRSLTEAVVAERDGDDGSRASSRSTPDDRRALSDLARTFMLDGPVVILYDDTFDGVADKGDALEAVATLVSTLAQSTKVGVLPMLDSCNSMGARDLNILPPDSNGGSWGRPVTERLFDRESQVRAAFLLGANVMREFNDEIAVQRLRRLDLLVVSELFLTETAKHADVILPAASFAEKAGTFTNTERRVQAINVAVPSPGIARSDWEMLVDLSQYFDRPLDYDLPRAIWEDIQRSVPEYADIGFNDVGPRGTIAGALQPV